MQLGNFYHRHALHHLRHDADFSLFEITIWLHSLARSLIAVFVPIFLLQAGFSINNIVLYYLIFNAIDVPLNFAVDVLMRKIGARWVMILGTIAMIAYFSLLGFLPHGNWPLLIVLALLAAAYDTLFWIAHLYIFIEANRKKADAGKAVGALEGVRKLAHIVGPVVGALLLINFGTVSVVLASTFVFILSIIPLYRLRYVRDLPQEKKVSIREFFSQPREQRDFLSVAFWGIHVEVDETIWPLFIFLSLGTVESLAAVPVVVSLATVLCSYLAGRLSKRYGTKMVIIGGLLIACAWILRAIIDNSTFYFASIFFIGFFSLLVSIPIDVNVANRGLKIGALASSTFRNATSMLLRIPLYLLLFVLLEVFKVSFVVAASSLFAIVLVMLLVNASTENRGQPALVQAPVTPRTNRQNPSLYLQKSLTLVPID